MSVHSDQDVDQEIGQDVRSLPQAVSEAVRRLDEVSALPLDQRPDEFQAIHDRLRSVLADLDDA